MADGTDPADRPGSGPAEVPAIALGSETFPLAAMALGKTGGDMLNKVPDLGHLPSAAILAIPQRSGRLWGSGRAP